MKKNFWTWLLHDKKKEKSSICMKICLCIAFFFSLWSISKCACTNGKINAEKGKCLDAGHHFCCRETKQNDIRV